MWFLLSAVRKAAVEAVESTFCTMGDKMERKQASHGPCLPDLVHDDWEPDKRQLNCSSSRRPMQNEAK